VFNSLVRERDQLDRGEGDPVPQRAVI